MEKLWNVIISIQLTQRKKQTEVVALNLFETNSNKVFSGKLNYYDNSMSLCNNDG